MAGKIFFHHRTKLVWRRSHEPMEMQHHLRHTSGRAELHLVSRTKHTMHPAKIEESNCTYMGAWCAVLQRRSLQMCSAFVSPNGLRYPLVGGTRKRRFVGINSKPHKLPENAQTPTSRVHAVLACLLPGSSPIIDTFHHLF